MYGRADRMAEYESLIHRLDQKPQLVELEATIIEVNSDSVDALGVNWSLRAGTSSIATNLPGRAPRPRSAPSCSTRAATCWPT